MTPEREVKIRRVTDDLPSWTFTVEEFAPGGYRVEGRDLQGRSVSITGDDPEKLLQDARAWAVKNADSLPIRPDQAE
jgi:hypothetical protein